MIFTLHQVQDGCREQLQTLHMAFTNLIKAFVSMSRGLFPPYKLYHQNTSISWRSILIIMRVIILANNGQCKQSDVRCGVKQVCVIAPTLFIIFIAIVIDMMKDDQPPRIEIVYRGNGRVFKLALLRSKTKS